KPLVEGIPRSSVSQTTLMPKGRPHLSRRQPEINESNRAKRALRQVHLATRRANAKLLKNPTLHALGGLLSSASWSWDHSRSSSSSMCRPRAGIYTHPFQHQRGVNRTPH